LPWSFRHSATLSRWLYILHHSNRDLPVLTSSPALVRTGRLFAVLVLAAVRLRTGSASSAQGRYPPGGARFHYYAAVQVFSCLLVNFAPILLRCPGAIPPTAMTQPAAAVSGDGDSSAMLYLGYVGMTCRLPSLCGAHHQVPGEKWIHITRR